MITTNWIPFDSPTVNHVKAYRRWGYLLQIKEIIPIEGDEQEAFRLSDSIATDKTFCKPSGVDGELVNHWTEVFRSGMTKIHYDVVVTTYLRIKEWEHHEFKYF